jgi:hypothetical protein
MDLAALGNKNIYDLLNTIFYLPAIVVGIEKKIWDTTLKKSNRVLPIIEIWNTLGLLNNHGNLTAKGEKIIRIESLIRYIIKMVPYHANDDLKSFNQISKSEYFLLRQGLGEYFLIYQSKLFTKLGYLNKEWRVLDYAGGAGKYSKNFLEHNPKSHCTVIDREKQYKKELQILFKEIDFEKNPLWYQNHHQKYNLIILSEILHCKNRETREYIIKSAYTLLDKEGEILIIEKTPTPYFQWRMDMFTHNGKCIEWMEIKKLSKIYNLKIKKTINLNSHYCVILINKNKNKKEKI